MMGSSLRAARRPRLRARRRAAAAAPRYPPLGPIQRAPSARPPKKAASTPEIASIWPPASRAAWRSPHDLVDERRRTGEGGEQDLPTQSAMLSWLAGSRPRPPSGKRYRAAAAPARQSRCGRRCARSAGCDASARHTAPAAACRRRVPHTTPARTAGGARRPLVESSFERSPASEPASGRPM
jgi:hypothetical protein